ncbi:MAG: type II toxin-antitoxin system HicA family toxin [Prevotellaceae bacterium]|jgi:predicted RNA binding protein YcfA (HicA-like mRNA interferase family)|nr:type II toxin-antitoxin system HicA family toxin [Prevotellaceae bacterium]
MTYFDLYKKIIANGWEVLRKIESNHYIYIKQGMESPPVPFHYDKEVGARLLIKIIKDMDLSS